jgi:hypothetical protein
MQGNHDEERRLPQSFTGGRRAISGRCMALMAGMPQGVRLATALRRPDIILQRGQATAHRLGLWRSGSEGMTPCRCRAMAGRLTQNHGGRATGSTRLRSLALPARFVRSGQWPRNGSYRPRGPSRGPTAGTRSPKAVLRPPGQLWGALSVPPTPDPFCKLIRPFHPHRRQAWARWCCSPVHQPLSCLCCGRSDPFKDFGARRDFGNAYPQVRGLERL